MDEIESKWPNEGRLAAVMSGRAWLLAALLVAVQPAGGHDSFRVEQLAWLEGCWDGDSPTRQFEECWSDPAGGMMIGFGRSISSAGQARFEFLRLIERDGAVIYLAQPGGTSVTEFVAVLVQEGLARFVNPEHDYPRVIEYRRDGDRLTALIGEGETIETSESVGRFHFVLRDH